MKNPLQKISFAILAIALLVANSSSAQDVIYKRNNEKIEAKVLEIGLDEIKYVPYDNPDGPVIAIDKDEVSKVKFETGSDWINTPDPYSIAPDPEIRNKNRAIKFNMFSPLFGYLGFGYEQMYKPGINIDATIGIIGPSISKGIDDLNPGGAFLKIGPKFKLGSEYRQRGVKYTHHLAGKYLMPQICFSSYKIDGEYTSSGYYVYTTETQRYAVNSFAFNLVFGKQSILGNVMVFDWNIGAGFGFQSTDKKYDPNDPYSSEDNFEAYNFSHFYGGPSFPMTFNASIAIGFLTK